MKPIVRTYRPENRLAKAIDLPGGITVAEALVRSAAGVEAVRAECMAGIDEKIAEIDAATCGQTFTSSAADVQRVYRLANEILNEAGVFGLTELSEAGRSLCDLTAGWSNGGIEIDPIRVHVAAMKSLRRPEVEGDLAVRAAVLDGLRRVTAKLTAKAAGG